MSAKEKRKFSKIILIISIISLLLIIIYIKYISSKETFAIETVSEVSKTPKISNAQEINIEEIIKNNTKQMASLEEIYERQEELEYITKYRYNNELYVGTTQVSQEGRNGIQTITMKKTYDNNGKLLGEEQVSCVVTKSSINKIIDIGTKIYVEPAKTTEGSSSRKFVI